MICLKNLLLEGMTIDVANTIFADFGVPNASELEKDKLKDYYIALVKKHHPDAGGRNTDMQYINAAYDVLKQSFEKSGSYGSGDESWPHQKEYDDYFAHNTYQHQHQKRKSKSRDDGPKGWAQAGWSGGAPFSGHIVHETFGDLNFCKKTAWEISGRPPFDKDHEYTFWNWDGNFFRGVFSVYAIPEKLFDISKMMVEWDSWNHSAAVFVTQKTKPNKIYVVNVKGNKIDPPRELEHDSFNSNPGNDNSFVNILRKEFTR